MELVHSDVNGPIETPYLGGSRYFATFIDDFSRWISFYTMKTNPKPSIVSEDSIFKPRNIPVRESAQSTLSDALVKLPKNLKHFELITAGNTYLMNSNVI